MTEQEMCNRMKEIDEERDRLRAEKLIYENYFSDKKKKEILDDHKSYIGKCFLTKGLSENEEKHIKAFKIIDVLDNPNERYAICTALIDGYRYTCWNEYGIQIMTLRLWTHNKLRMMSSDTEPIVLDFYKEISQEKFESFYREYQGIIEKIKCTVRTTHLCGKWRRF